MYIGLSKYYDAYLQDKLYKSYTQRSSIRTISSKFAYYRTGLPILLSDCISFDCRVPNCRKGYRLVAAFAYISRIIGVRRDFRSSTSIVRRGQVILQIQELFYLQDILSNTNFKLPLAENEVFLSQNNVFFCTKTQVRHRFDIVLDYTFGNNKLSPDRALYTCSTSLILRRIVDFGSNRDIVITPLYLNYPIRRELEITVFGRTYIESLDSRMSRERKTILLPLITFIDAFGLYRNLYCSLIGIYFILAALNTYERNRRANVSPLILRPYSSNFVDVVEAIRLLSALDKGIKVYIPREGIVLLVAFTFAFLGDMPQQQKNSRIKTQRTNLSYRICYIYTDFRGLLDYDIFLKGRYYYTVIEIRKDIENLGTKAARKVYGVKQGIDLDTAAIVLTRISLALDIIQTRLGNPAYSKYQGLSSIINYLLLDRKYLSLTIGSKNLLTLDIFYRYPYAKSVQPIRRYSTYVSFPTILAPGLRSTILS